VNEISGLALSLFVVFDSIDKNKTHNNIKDKDFSVIVNKSILNRAKKIKLVITDVDGVLTDGGMYYSSKGDIMKKFHVRDGMGVTLLRKIGVPTLIITKEQTPMVRQWAKKMKIKKLFDGVVQKEKMIRTVCDAFNVRENEIAYIGDDINDVSLLKIVGFAAAPNDAISLVKNNSDYVCEKKGGEGAFREVAEIILLAKAKS
jgi:YrbI family 3-deoxy-D-manno-octulosonate 8-phosphate phosphatase